eukprot:6491684-Amphidinium_carterae.3
MDLEQCLAAKWCSFHPQPSVSIRCPTVNKPACCKCGKDHQIVGCMFEGCDHYSCENHSLRVDGGLCGTLVDTGLHATRPHLRMTVVMRSGVASSTFREGICGVCGDNRGIARQYDGCDRIVCLAHAEKCRDDDSLFIQMWCRGHKCEQPTDDTPVVRRCTMCFSKENVYGPPPVENPDADDEDEMHMQGSEFPMNARAPRRIYSRSHDDTVSKTLSTHRS